MMSDGWLPLIAEYARRKNPRRRPAKVWNSRLKRSFGETRQECKCRAAVYFQLRPGAPSAQGAAQFCRMTIGWRSPMRWNSMSSAQSAFPCRVKTKTGLKGDSNLLAHLLAQEYSLTLAPEGTLRAGKKKALVIRLKIYANPHRGGSYPHKKQFVRRKRLWEQTVDE